MTLFTPAIDFILQTVAYDAPESLLSDLLEQCKRKGNSPLVLNAIMAAFKPSYVTIRAWQFLEMIENSANGTFFGCNMCGIDLFLFSEDLPLHILLRTLGLCVSVCPPPSEQQRQVLAAVWRNLSALNVPEQYISCAEVWMQFTVQYFGVNNEKSLFLFVSCTKLVFVCRVAKLMR